MEHDYSGSSLQKLGRLQEKTAQSHDIVRKQIETREVVSQSARTELRKDHINNIGIALMWFFGSAMVVFVGLVFYSGLFSDRLPQTPGFAALADTFVGITSNAKIIFFIILGYFFRDYAQEMRSFFNHKDG